MTFYGFGGTRDYYKAIEKYIYIERRRVKYTLFISPNDRIPSEILLRIPFFITTRFQLEYKTSDLRLGVRFSI